MVTNEDPLFAESVGGDNLGEVLAGTLRLLGGAVAVEYVPASPSMAPVVWADLTFAAVTAALHDAVTQRLAAGGPWGEAVVGSSRAWIEPVEAPSAPGTGRAIDGTQAAAGTEGQAASGAFGVAFVERSPLTPEEIDTVRLFARLAGAIAVLKGPAPTAPRRGRLDVLVSRISERLMSTTSPTLRDSLDWAVEELCTYLGADVAFLRRNDRARSMSVLMAFYPPRGIPLEEDPLGMVPFDADPIFAATKDLKVPLIVRNAAETDDRYLQRVRDAGGSDEFTGAAVPLVHGDVTEGILAFVYLTPYTWSEHEINALRAVASLLVQLLHRVDAEERLRHSALTDDLTGLPNRRALLEEASRRQLSGAGSTALIFIDLDRFKVMNDQLGHIAGDTVLRVLADRIRTSLRPADFAARLGGDEFVVLLDDVDAELGAVAAANRLLELIARPIDVRGQRVAHTGSVGIAITENADVTAEALLGQADVALYAAKAQGRNRAVVFDHELEASVAERSTVELLLRQALDEDALRVMYQPEFDLETGELLAAEALVRWFRAGEGFVEASLFVPIAEETHLIIDIDRWVLERACAQLASWRRRYGKLDMVVRVNVSPTQLATAGLVQSVTDCLRKSGLPPEALCLEITEQAVIADVDQAVGVLQDIRSMGVKLAIDDFGTGFSSMSQLRSLPVDVLKIDRVFIDGIAKDPTDQAIVDTIVRLARAFELDVVGEGIERLDDLSTLVRLGCRRGQGFLLARPLPPEELVPILEKGGVDLEEFMASTSRSSWRRATRFPRGAEGRRGARSGY